LGGHPKTIFLAMPVRQYARIPRMLRDAVISLLLCPVQITALDAHTRIRLARRSIYAHVRWRLHILHTYPPSKWRTLCRKRR